MFIAVLLSYVQFPFLCVKQEHVPLLLPFYLVASHSPFCVKRIEHCRPGCWKSTNYYCQGGALGTWSVSASHQPVINCCCAVRLLWECWSVPTAMHTANSVPSTDSLRTLSCWPAAWAGLPPVCWAGMMESLWNQQLFYAFLVVHHVIISWFLCRRLLGRVVGMGGILSARCLRCAQFSTTCFPFSVVPFLRGHQTEPKTACSSVTRAVPGPRVTVTP